MSPQAVKRASYNLAWAVVHNEGDAELMRRFQVVTGCVGDVVATLRFAEVIVKVGR
jgi:hypothetical protein